MTLAEKIRHLPVTREKKGRRGLMTDPFEEMDHMFERLLGRSLLRDWMHPRGWLFEAAGEGAALPRVDVIDRENEVEIRAEMPGVAKEDLDISLGDNTITLRGTIKQEHEEKEGEYCYFKETGRGEFVRTLTLPAAVDGAKAKATFKDGVVTIMLPKMETAKRHKIKIN